MIMKGRHIPHDRDRELGHGGRYRRHSSTLNLTKPTAAAHIKTRSSLKHKHSCTDREIVPIDIAEWMHHHEPMLEDAPHIAGTMQLKGSVHMPEDLTKVSQVVQSEEDVFVLGDQTERPGSIIITESGTDESMPDDISRVADVAQVDEDVLMIDDQPDFSGVMESDQDVLMPEDQAEEPKNVVTDLDEDDSMVAAQPLSPSSTQKKAVTLVSGDQSEFSDIMQQDSDVSVPEDQGEELRSTITEVTNDHPPMTNQVQSPHDMSAPEDIPLPTDQSDVSGVPILEKDEGMMIEQTPSSDDMQSEEVSLIPEDLPDVPATVEKEEHEAMLIDQPLSSDVTHSKEDAPLPNDQSEVPKVVMSNEDEPMSINPPRTSVVDAEQTEVGTPTLDNQCEVPDVLEKKDELKADTPQVPEVMVTQLAKHWELDGSRDDVEDSGQHGEEVKVPSWKLEDGKRRKSCGNWTPKWNKRTSYKRLPR